MRTNETQNSAIPYFNLQKYVRSIRMEIDVGISRRWTTAFSAWGRTGCSSRRTSRSIATLDTVSALTNVTSALHVVLRLPNVDPGDEAITTPHTVFAAKLPVAFSTRLSAVCPLIGQVQLGFIIGDSDVILPIKSHHFPKP